MHGDYFEEMDEFATSNFFTSDYQASFEQFIVLKMWTCPIRACLQCIDL